MLGGESDEGRDRLKILWNGRREPVHERVEGRERERKGKGRRGWLCVEGLQSPFAVRPWGGWGLAGAEGGETMRRMCN